MSILVRGMEMPEECARCRLLEGDARDGLCHGAEKWLDDDYFIWPVFPEGDIDLSKPLNCPLVEVEEFEVWPNRDPSRKFNILKTKGGMHFMGPNGPVEAPKEE